VNSRCFQDPREAFDGLPPPALPGPPRLLVLVAVEEPFDWDQIPAAGTPVDMDLGRLAELQDGLQARGILPTYALDYPAVEANGELFGEWARADRALIGAHLHPWVNPPFGSEESGQSFGANLPPALEADKLAELFTLIRARTGTAPLLYQAGRYGVGPQTLAQLEAHGIELDASLSPGFDYAHLGGPDFRRFDSRPRWYRGGRVLSVPVTGGYLGALSGLGPKLHRSFEADLARRARLPALLDRAGLYGRLRLSPEGNSGRDLERLTEALLGRGERLFTLYLHSSSLVAGATGYARDPAAVEALLTRTLAFVDWFRSVLGGQPGDHRSVLEHCRSAARGATPGLPHPGPQGR
jgi:hypothetical protein